MSVNARYLLLNMRTGERRKRHCTFELKPIRRFFLCY